MPAKGGIFLVNDGSKLNLNCLNGLILRKFVIGQLWKNKLWDKKAKALVNSKYEKISYYNIYLFYAEGAYIFFYFCNWNNNLPVEER